MRTSIALAALGAQIASAVVSLEVSGSDFINPTTKDRFQVVGVAYQPGGSAGYNPEEGFDPLSSPSKCLRDAAIMQILGINAIRVYNLDPDLNHDACASIFNAAGMYMMIDVNSPLVGESLDSSAPWTTYTKAYLNRTFAIVEAFRHYPNTLLFFAGNEVINDEATAKYNPQYVRAVTRDIKQYIAKNADRPIPVGYSAADVRSVLFDSWNYFSCSEADEDDNMSRADVFALNSYSWCGDSSYTTSSYDKLVAGFTGTSVPIFFSEFGCNTPAPRIFTEVGAMYGKQMTPVFSGGVVYEYTYEANEFGLVNVSSDGSVTLLEDYYALQTQYSKIDFKTLQSAAADGASVKPPTCSSKLITSKDFSTNFTLPSQPVGVDALISKGISPAPTGKIISISDYNVNYTVRNENGTELTGLAVKPLASNAVNTPGSNTATSSTTKSSAGSSSSSSSSTASSSSSSSSSKSAAFGRAEMLWVPAVALGAIFPTLFALFL